MNRVKSKEVAFFNLLKSLISPNIKDEALDYSVSVEDLKEKMEIDKMIISGFLNRLSADGILDVKVDREERVNLHFERTHTKLLDFLAIDDLDKVIGDIKEFLGNNLEYCNFQVDNTLFNKYALITMEGLEKEGPAFDMTDLIEAGVKEIFNREEVMIRVNKLLYRIACNADDKDLEVLEGILYCCLNLPFEENPFYITLFLMKTCFQMEMLKKQRA